MSSQKLSLEGISKELKMKNERLRQLNGLIEEKMRENEGLKNLQRRTEKDSAGKEGMLRFELEQKEQLLEEIKRLEQEKLLTKQQLEDALYDLDKQTGKRRNAEIRMNLHCGANDEFERMKKQNEDLQREKRKHVQRLENQEATVKKLIETISKLEEANALARQALNRTERRREEELEERKASFQKEMQALESRMGELLDEKEMELNLMVLKESRLKQVLRSSETKFKARERKLRKRLKKLPEVSRGDGDDPSDEEKPNVLVKMLRSKLEDTEDELESMRRSKRGVEEEMEMVQGQLDSMISIRNELEERNRSLLRENNGLASRAEDWEDECELLRMKHSKLLHQTSLDQQRLHEQSEELEELREKLKLHKSEAEELQEKLQRLESSSVSSHVLTRMESQLAEMKTSAEMDSFAKKQAESQLARSKEVLQKERSENARLRALLEKKDGEVSSLQGALKVQKSRVVCLETRLQDLERLVSQLRRKLDERQEECTDHREEIGLLNRRIAALKTSASMHWTNVGRDDGEEEEEEEEDNDGNGDDIGRILARGKVLLLSPGRSLLESSEA